ncbi:GspH/FimT family protein [Proteinivorax tanatarense]|uniref:GspH/FimT family protein n=1 Tax=Proteinivorax tanatarense TaxID=1260629 RepID=A0AAU7VPJ3_9FIRM
MVKFKNNNSLGFTLLELLVVVSILGMTMLIATSFVLNVTDNTSLNLEIYAQKALADLQYAQQQAMSSGTAVFITFPSGCSESYIIHKRNNVIRTFELPHNLKMTNNFFSTMVIHRTGLSQQGGRIVIRDEYNNQAIILFDVIGGRLRLEMNYND